MITFKEWLMIRETQQARLALSKIRGDKTLKVPQRVDIGRIDALMKSK
jgi:hypothetical protein